MKWIGSFLLCICCWSQAREVRSFWNAERTSSFQAGFVRFEPESRAVTLRKDKGGESTFSLSLLSASDQEYVLEQHRLDQLAKQFRISLKEQRGKLESQPRTQDGISSSYIPTSYAIQLTNLSQENHTDLRLRYRIYLQSHLKTSTPSSNPFPSGSGSRLPFLALTDTLEVANLPALGKTLLRSGQVAVGTHRYQKQTADSYQTRSYNGKVTTQRVTRTVRKASVEKDELYGIIVELTIGDKVMEGDVKALEIFQQESENPYHQRATGRPVPMRPPGGRPLPPPANPDS